MKERPILFSGPMVRAILEGRKTQTRRVVKLPPAPNHLGVWEPTTFGGEGLYLNKRCTKPASIQEQVAIEHTRTGDCVLCPYGVPGDRLWVRETWIEGFPTGQPNCWSCIRPTDCADNGKPFYRADGGDPVDGPQRPWCRSIFMPRWASRITLEVTDVRVQRVQEISEEDANAEGMVGSPLHGKFWYRENFAGLWDTINAKRGHPWASNPWVWAITFQRLAA